MSPRLPRLLLVELNEFSVDLFRRGMAEMQLPNIERLLAMRASRTTTDDRVEHRGLDPWVQWVSIHTGLPSSRHGIVHLGDAPSSSGMRQLWETLSARGVSSGVWGAMNATRGSAERCVFFLPDPWTFEEDAYPAPLGDLLALPRYYSRNYLDVSKAAFARGTLRLARYVLGSGAMPRILGMTPLILRGLWRNGINNAMLFSLFDLFSAALFLEQRRLHRPRLTLIFLNSIAHLQHHRWVAGARLSDDLRFGLRAIDRVLGMLFESREEDEALVVVNALTQRNIVHEKPRILYRQINPARFLRALGFAFDSVEQLMTNDAHVFFPDRAARDRAAGALERVTLQGVPLFHVEPSLAHERKMFYQVDFWDELETDTEVSVNGREIRFLDHFEAVVARTGAHVPEGDVFADGVMIPPRLYNHEIAAYLIGHLTGTAPSAPPTRAGSSAVPA